VFSRWADPETWPQWDAEVREVSFEGPAKLGARGRMRPASGPATSFTITAFEPDRVFTNASSMPGARLVFEHIVTPAADGARVEVTVHIDGPFAPLWKRIVGRSLAGAARSSVTGLLASVDAT
jgi:uncharacterized protein YndB with AHSA1/START domain